jgi:nitroreductase
MLLMVTALGLGACWVIAPCIDIRDEERLKDLLGVPEEVKIISIVAVGHPTRPHRPRPRLPMHKLVYDEKWDVAYYEEVA